MNSLGFDTHAYVKKLKAVGFTEEQAEVQTRVIAELIESHLATKHDLKELQVAVKELEASLRRDMKELEATLKRDIKELESSLRRDLKELETTLRRDMKEMELRLRHDLTLRLGGMLVAGIAVVAALVKLL